MAGTGSRTNGTISSRGRDRSCCNAAPGGRTVRSRSARMRAECSAPRTTTKTTTASRNSAPSSSAVEPVPPSPEKKIESRMIAPKSAIDAAAMISCPRVDEISPGSLSTGTRTPSEVAHRMIATSSGVSTRPAAFGPSETASAIANESAKAAPVRRSSGPRSLSNSISSPARKSTNASPSRATTSTEASTSARPSTDGPITMPATISSTTDRSCAAGRGRGAAARRRRPHRPAGDW